jgi:hypothetical protein
LSIIAHAHEALSLSLIISRIFNNYLRQEACQEENFRGGKLNE